MICLVCVGRRSNTRVVPTIITIVGVECRAGVLRLLTVRRRGVSSTVLLLVGTVLGVLLGVLLGVIVHWVSLVVGVVAVLRRRCHPAGTIDWLITATAAAASC